MQLHYVEYGQARLELSGSRPPRWQDQRRHILLKSRREKLQSARARSIPSLVRRFVKILIDRIMKNYQQCYNIMMKTNKEVF